MASNLGSKMSGNGREWGEIAFDDFLEIKAVVHREAAYAKWIGSWARPRGVLLTVRGTDESLSSNAIRRAH